MRVLFLFPVRVTCGARLHGEALEGQAPVISLTRAAVS